MATEATYPLATPPSPGASTFTSTPGVKLSKFTDFLGFGIVTPFRRGPADFVSDSGVAFIQSMIRNVLGVRCDSDFTTGELPWRTEFGSLVHHLRHQNNDTIRAELARVYVADALARWVPQVRLKSVSVTREVGPGGEENVMLIRLRYDLISVNRQGNSVLLPDVGQDVAFAEAA